MVAVNNAGDRFSVDLRVNTRPERVSCWSWISPTGDQIVLCWCASVCANVVVCICTGVQIYWCENVLVCKSAGVQMCECTNGQMCNCRCAGFESLVIVCKSLSWSNTELCTMCANESIKLCATCSVCMCHLYVPWNCVHLALSSSVSWNCPTKAASKSPSSCLLS